MAALCVIALLCARPTSTADEIAVGHLLADDSGYRIERVDGEMLTLDMPERYVRELPSLTRQELAKLRTGCDDKGKPLAYPILFLSFRGQRKGPVFHACEAPSVLTGYRRLRGTLARTPAGYMLQGHAVVFDRPVKVLGTAFDQASIDAFVGRDVDALCLKRDGAYVITAIVLADLYSAKPATAPEFPAGLRAAELSVRIKTFLLGRVYRDEISQASRSFRERIYTRRGYRPSQGDTGLIITLSGRHGDDPGAIAGHLAAGRVRVRDNRDLDIEMWNFYMQPNRKCILPGYGSHIDYFGHITAGQNNYRPSYSVILYGIPAADLQRMRDRFGRPLHLMRQGSEDFGAFRSCATMTVDSLNTVGIESKRVREISSLATKAIAVISAVGGAVYPGVPRLLGFKREAWRDFRSYLYAMWHDPSRYLPRCCFDGYLARLEAIIQAHDVDAVDFIFNAQTPSARRRGGAPAGRIMTVRAAMYNLLPAAESPDNPWPPERTQQEIDLLMQREAPED